MRLPSILATFGLLASSLLAQPTAPSPDALPALRAATEIDLHRAAAASPLTVNPASREEVRQFYRTIYAASDNVPIGWTGSYTTGAAGTTTAAYQEAVLLRINFFRALAGVPATVVLNSTFSAKAQQAALMMSVNQALSHFPPPAWTFYTAAGAEAAGSSNIAIGYAGPEAISGYIADDGPSNAGVGHRRWLLYPHTREMGTGDVPGNGANLFPANATWVFDSQFGTTRPATRTTAITYPPAGFVPHPLVWPRWSFSHPGADFSSTTVTMIRNGQSVAVAPEPVSTNVGEPTFVWVYDGLSGNSATTHPRPTADTTYTVNVTNVRIAGVAQNFTYQVTVFDPDTASADALPMRVSGSTAPTVGSANAYTVARPTFASGFEWRPLQLAPYAKTYTADTGLDGITAAVSADYPAIQTAVTGAGSGAFHLAHPMRVPQSLLLPETFFVSGAGANLTFLSRLGFATTSQIAHAQVSTDDGQSWADVYTQAGIGAAGETGFLARSASLAAYSGRTVRVRFTYTVPANGSAYPQTTAGVGWYLDNIALTGVQTATPGATTGVAAASAFSYTPVTAGSVALQARGVLFNAYPLEWGPVTLVNAVDAPGAVSTAGRLINLSIRTDFTAATDTVTMGYVIGGTGAKPLVIRAVGPSLAAFGLTNFLADPKLEVYAVTTKTGDNDNWGGGPTLASAMAAVGAFPYAGPTSRDSAVAASTSSRDNSVIVSGTGTGTVIAELYDATPAANFTAATPRLINVSIRKHLGGGVIAGFVLGGSAPTRVLVRAIGPTLGLFGVPDIVADPQLTLYSGQTVVAANNNWGGTTELTTAFAATGAFALPAASNDAAVVATLAPGDYTVQVSGVNNTTGVALVEVYEVP